MNGANLSVCVSDGFMEAVKKDGDWDLVYPDLDDPKYDTKWNGEIDQWKKLGGKVKVHKTIKARELWNLICDAAWRSAEPGLHFLERSNKRSNTWYFERLIATNPCGEQPLGAWAVCNLGAMNLTAYVKDEKFDYKSFGEDVKIAMRFMDNVIDKTYYFFKENEKVAKDIRRTGLGIMGLGDALIKMQVRYGSDESLPVIEKIFETLRNSAYEASTDIAKEKGAFPKFNKAKYLKGYHIKGLPKALATKIAKQGIRNAVLLTIAPTGTTSLLSGVTSGIEPVYEFTFIRRDRTGEHIMYHPLYEEWKKQNPDGEKPSYYVSANDLTPMEHAQVQGVA
ncbi:MAG: ribonucleoside-diphosphate reductase, adenosylcobalamin-dependent, partial [Patescibacteria group bacterium]